MSIEIMSATTASAQALNKPVLNSGSKGPDVIELQTLINGYAESILSHDIGTFVDGYFGPSTQLAVRLFQRQVFLPQTGIVANLTWRALYLRGPVDRPQIGNGSYGEDVSLLQQTLVNLRLLTGKVDGEFGPLTRLAVVKFQRQSGLVADGIVGDKTWFALSKRNHQPRN